MHETNFAILRCLLAWLSACLSWLGANTHSRRFFFVEVPSQRLFLRFSAKILKHNLSEKKERKKQRSVFCSSRLFTRVTLQGFKRIVKNSLSQSTKIKNPPPAPVSPPPPSSPGSRSSASCSRAVVYQSNRRTQPACQLVSKSSIINHRLTL